MYKSAFLASLRMHGLTGDKASVFQGGDKDKDLPFDVRANFVDVDFVTNTPLTPPAAHPSEWTKDLIDKTRILQKLVDPNCEYVVLSGPRGTGKSIAFGVATKFLNDGRRGSVALQISCASIGLVVERERKARSRIGTTAAVFSAVLGEIRRGFAEIESVLKKDESNVSGVLFGDIKKTHKALYAFQDAINALLAKFGIAHSEAARDRLSSEIKNKLSDIETRLPQLFGGFYKALAATKRIKRLFIFFDDFSEAPADVRESIVSVFTPLLAVKIADVAIKIRLSTYWGDGNPVFAQDKNAVDEVATDPYALFGGQDLASLAELEARQAAYLECIVRRRASFFKVQLSEFVTARDDEEVLEFFRVGCRYSGCSVRLFGRLLDQATGQGRLPVSAKEFAEKAGLFLRTFRGSLLQEFVVPENRASKQQVEHLKELFNEIPLQVRLAGRNEESFIVSGRFLVIDIDGYGELIKPLINSGLIFLVRFLPQNALGANLGAFAINTGISDQLVSPATGTGDDPEKTGWGQLADERLTTSAYLLLRERLKTISH